MRIDARALGLAAGLTAAVLAAVCRLAFMVEPEGAARAAGLLVHADWAMIGRPPTIGSLLFGVVAWGVGTGLTFGFGGWLYNRVAAAGPRMTGQERLDALHFSGGQHTPPPRVEV